MWPAGIACLLVAGAAFTGGYKMRDLMADSADLKRAEIAAEQQRLVQRTRDTQQGKADAQARRYHARERQIDRAATADRATADSLRDTLDRVSSGATDSACADVRRQRDGLASLVAEAGSLVAECKTTGDRLAEQTSELRRSATQEGQLPLTAP